MEWAAKLCEENGKEIYDSFLSAIKGGDWRASEVILTRIYGKPVQTTVELEQSDLDRVSTMTDEERAALRRQIDERHARLAALPPATDQRS